MPTQRRILVTSALPYANGPLHLGHMLEQVQTDIWVRFQKSRGNSCLYVCADDAHGTAIMLAAENENLTAEEYVNSIWRQHKQDSADFSIDFSVFHTTHSTENREWSRRIYKKLKSNNDITSRKITQAYDSKEKLFLADRFIKGTCPKCNAEDQYGDNCEACGATYNPADLINPISTISGETPIEKDSEHFFFRLQNYQTQLEKWIKSGTLQPQVANKLNEWIEMGLQDWDISRDAPYFGFEIPGTEDKFFYVWLDAPIGYIASFEHYCKESEFNFEEYWNEGNETELYHFIGKDIVNFHGLFWPAVLKSSGLRLPTGIFAHGFLTVNGAKMSKSRGTFIKASTYLQYLDSDYLRYYYAAKLNGSVDDIDLNLDDFIQRVNSDLVGKVVNIASRCSGFIEKTFENRLSKECGEENLIEDFICANENIAKLYEAREFNKAIRSVMDLADRANQYINDKKPWVLAKNANEIDEVHSICSVGINLFRILMIYLKPVLPKMSIEAEKFLNCSLEWTKLENLLIDHDLNRFEPLITRIDPKVVKMMMEESKVDDTPDRQREERENFIAIKDFSKIDIRIGEIVAAEQVENADKLLRLRINLGGLGERQILSAIRPHYLPEDLVGRLTLVIANLKPRKMRFGISDGMLLMAGDESQLYLLSPDSGARAGMSVN
ncbi:MAG: methionine--tRNA ligase [Halieaceae bacterium]|nr:methionine--tRNA ligase [Halieaceae bacterium]